jgi:hypothetical protein
MDPSIRNVGVIEPWSGYTVRPSAAVTLRFPVLDSARSMRALNKTARPALWSATLWAADEHAFAELNLSKSAYSRRVPAAPMIPGQTFRAAFGRGADLWGGVHESAAQGAEGHWSLRFSKEAGFKGLTVQLREFRGQEIPLAEVEQGDFHIVAGGPEYVESFLKGVTGAYHLRLVNFPNPFGAQTSIRFSLPGTFSDVDYRVRIFDFQGRLVWEKIWKGGSELNTGWDGRTLSGRTAPAGQYHLMVEAKVPGRSAFQAKRKLIKLN